MKVLLITEDLYKTIGGGQTVYRKIIESTPGIEFYYFLRDEPIDAQRPRNAIGVRLFSTEEIRVLSDPPFPQFLRAALNSANRYAAAVAGQAFDIIDVPDFLTVGGVLRDACAYHKVSVKRFVLALHGNISDSIELSWGSPGDNVREVRTLEQRQYIDADAIYGISPRYIKKWQSKLDRPVHFIDPLHFISQSKPRASGEYTQQARSNLYCIGRMERLKGNDLFIELIRWLDPNLYEKAFQVGDEIKFGDNQSSLDLLKHMEGLRQIHTDVLSSFNREQLKELFAKKSVVVLPVRHDSLNLVALEAIFNGCPLAISGEAGVCDYLDTHFPQLPYIKLDLKKFYEGVKQVSELLKNYDSHRDQLEIALGQISRPVAPLEIGTWYEKVLREEPNSGAATRKFIKFAVKRNWAESLRGSLAAPLFGVFELVKKGAIRIGSWLNPVRIGLRVARALGLVELFEDQFFDVLIDSRDVPWRLHQIAHHGERSQRQQAEKLLFIYSRVRDNNPLFRCNYWLDIARLERSLGNEVVAATYELRALRLIGHDPIGLLPGLLATLNERGFKEVARTVAIMYGGLNDAGEALHGFLKESYERNLKKPELSFARTLDQRSGVPKVSVIVSLYNAASKLKLFLTCLSQQTLMREMQQVELIFVDSGSPTNELEVIEEFMAHTPLNMIYARSAERETIQAAWNRGIRLARADKLVFLGADETLFPEALEVLARELEQNDQVDWVMADSLVTSVDKHGTLANDVMPYMRSDAWKDMVYLETCYLSWVGGMYRKRIHQQFGFYDETFGAAGDTEFKNRLLPHINVRFIPRMLGLFLDYPEARTTASSKAEIEDFRAWYVHRTPAGIRYAFDERPVEDVEKLFLKSLGYRKSYCRHLSSDVEMATYLAEYLVGRGSGLVTQESATRLQSYLEQMRSYEYMSLTMSALRIQWGIIKLWIRTRQLQRFLKRAFERHGATPAIRFFNDNRFEQHSNLWKTANIG